MVLLLLLLRKRTCNHNKLSVLSKDAWSANIYSQSWSISVPVANELMNSLMGKWFCLFIQKSIHKMNNPIFVFSLDSIIECWFDYCFLKNYTFHTESTSEFCFFFFFNSSKPSAGEFWSSNPNKLLHVSHFAASNQSNTMVKLWSVYVRWLVDFDPRPLSVYAIVNGRKREANTIERNRQE